MLNLKHRKLSRMEIILLQHIFIMRYYFASCLLKFMDLLTVQNKFKDLQFILVLFVCGMACAMEIMLSALCIYGNVVT